MANRATIMIVHEGEPVNCIVTTEEYAEEWIAKYDGVHYALDPEDEFFQDLLKYTDCIAVNITGMDPMPGLGLGWRYVDGEWIAPSTD